MMFDFYYICSMKIRTLTTNKYNTWTHENESIQPHLLGACLWVPFKLLMGAVNLSCEVLSLGDHTEITDLLLEALKH